MAIQKRVSKKGTVTFIARWRDKGGKEHSKSFSTRREAKAFEAQLTTRAARGFDTAPRQITVLELYNAWLGSRTVRESSRGRYVTTRDYQLVPLHDFPAADVTSGDINAWRVRLETGRGWISRDDTGIGPVSVRNAMIHLASAFKWGVQEDLVPRNPVRVPRRRYEVEPDEFPTPAEIKRVIDCVRDGGATYEVVKHAGEYETVTQRPKPVVADLMKLVSLTGLRASEATGLTVGDVDLAAMVLHVRKQLSADGKRRVELKTERSRRDVPISPELVPMLSEYVAGKDRSALLFRTKSGAPITASRLGAVVRNAAIFCGASRVHMHALRHVFASGLLTTGVPVQDVAKALGHSIEVLLRTYAHVLEGHSERVARGIAAGVESGIFAGSPQLRVVGGGA